jgi:hypothetical protein
MSSNAEYVTKMDAQLKTWDAEAATLAADVERANALVRAAQDLGMKELRASRDAAHKVFREIGAVKDEAVAAQMHSSMEAAWEVMQSTLKATTSKLKQ